ncbi:MAG: S41 family peptidase [Xanthomonadaceae bacterium]|jgi:hypothetical protein|nr:S41 family peptidase [Xanthomonadaceae bacterium]
MLRTTCIALAFTALCAPLASAAPAAEAPAPIDWRAAYLSDLEAAHAAIRDHHPGAIDPRNPGFRERLDDGFAQARALAPKVGDGQAYWFGLRRFAHALGDPHTGFLRDDADPAARWPGFLLVERDGDWVVARGTGDALPPDGARVLDCDGRTPAQLAQALVFPFTLDARLAAHRREAASRALVDRGNPLAPLPRRCRFEHDGRTRGHVLAWQPIATEALQAMIDDALWGRRDPAITWREPAEGVAWLQIPTFYPESEADVAALEGLIARLAAERERLHAARLVVFDLRGNGGGTSSWGDRLVEALWGEAAAAYRPAEAPATDWRATQGNLDYWLAVRTQLAPRFDADPALARYVDGTIAGLRAALASGAPYYRETAAAPAEAAPVTPWPLRAPVAFLTDGQCASACLNFADWMVRLPGATHVGAETAADAVYIESRFIALPSGRARLLLAQKVLRDGPRADMQPYAPDIAYGGAWTREAVTTWVLGLLRDGRLAAAPGASH